MIAVDQASSLRSLLKNNVLQKTVKVVSYIDCFSKPSNLFSHKICENMSLNNREAVVFIDDINEDLNEKKINVVDNGIKYIYSTNILSDDIFKSKFNQEILRKCSLLSESEFKNLDFIMVNVKNIFDISISKILNFSDKFLIFCDTSIESLDKVKSLFDGKDFRNRKFYLILKQYEKNSDWSEWFLSLKEEMYDLSGAEIEILDLLPDKFSNIELFKTTERIFIKSVEESTSKNLSFFDFIVNSLT